MAESSTANMPRFGYTGQAFWSESNLYYYKARLYSPALGRFLQTDPIGYDAGDTNLYAYVGDDAVNRTDPTGLAPDFDDILDAIDGFGEFLSSQPELGGGVAGRAVKGIGTGAREARAAVTALKEVRAAQLAKNVAQGARAEAQTAAKLGDRIAGRQVTFKTSTGQRTRIDFVTKDRKAVETKFGNAGSSKGQQQL